MRVCKLIIVLFMLISQTGYCHPSDEIEKNADKTINQLYQQLKLKPITAMPDRITWFSAQFIDKPYLLGALGEGAGGSFDQFPLYRTDAFDCDTYVNTVLALALSKNLTDFKKNINKLRYAKGQVDYLYRNHFTDLDWNGNNQKQGILLDITRSIKLDNQSKPAASTAMAVIDKPSWYQFKTNQNIRLFDESPELEKTRLIELKNLGKTLPVSEAKIPYLPLNILFNKKGEANLKLFAKIPTASIIEIVRPNWDLKLQIGTCLNVSHLGFAIWNNKTLYFRNASSLEGKVVDTPLIGYLRNYLKSPTVKGINIQIVIPASALS